MILSPRAIARATGGANAGAASSVASAAAPLNSTAEPPDLVPSQFQHDAVTGSDEKWRNVANGYALGACAHGRSSSENHGGASSIGPRHQHPTPAVSRQTSDQVALRRGRLEQCRHVRRQHPDDA